ncbi:MAG TPA: hypothetical protein VKD66_09885 [Streptosporangiaceae bacterium]|nr:hypothetical protein [Streptosporangiaceae bacterium]
MSTAKPIANPFDTFPRYPFDTDGDLGDPRPYIRGSLTLQCLTRTCSVSSINIRFDADNTELALEPRCPGCQAQLPLCRLTRKAVE